LSRLAADTEKRVTPATSDWRMAIAAGTIVRVCVFKPGDIEERKGDDR
jgi:hypothetical protein